MDLDKEFGNKLPRIIQDLSGNLEAKYSLKAQLGVTNENSATNYQVSPAQKDEPILIKVIVSSIFTFISSQILCQALKFTNIRCADHYVRSFANYWSSTGLTFQFQKIKEALGDTITRFIKCDDPAKINALDLSCQHLQRLTNLPKPDKFLISKDNPLDSKLCPIGSLFKGLTPWQLRNLYIVQSMTIYENEILVCLTENFDSR